MVKSISKTPITRAIAAQIAHDAFGDVRLLGTAECTEGMFNAVHLLTMADGRQAILKVAPPPDVAVLRYEHDIMAAEVAVMRLVADRTAVPIARVLWQDTSCTRVPSDLFLMEALPGDLLNGLRSGLSADQQQRIDVHIATSLREINALTRAGFGLAAPSAPVFERWSDAFTRMVDDVLADGEAAAVTLPVAADRVRAVVRNAADLLDEVTEARLVHWDLWDGNVLVDPVGGRVTGLIDFERALWGDPVMELQFRSAALDPAFADAYGSRPLDVDGARQRRLLYDLYLFLVMVIEVAYRQYPTDDMDRYSRHHLDRTLQALGLSA